MNYHLLTPGPSTPAPSPPCPPAWLRAMVCSQQCGLESKQQAPQLSILSPQGTAALVGSTADRNRCFQCKVKTWPRRPGRRGWERGWEQARLSQASAITKTRARMGMRQVGLGYRHLPVHVKAGSGRGLGGTGAVILTSESWYRSVGQNCST